MGDVVCSKKYDIYCPPSCARFFDGPWCSILDAWRVFGRDVTDGGVVAGAIVRPKFNLQPEPFGGACNASWRGCALLKHDQPPGNQLFGPID
eukprot:11126494-Lingulodinium_polyedra.AAC.1